MSPEKQELSLPPASNHTITNKNTAAKTAAPKPNLTPIITITPPDIKIERISGRGHGLIVTKAFKPGELILMERPLILANHAPGQELQDSIISALRAACPDSLRKFYRLYNPLKLWSYWDSAYYGKFITLEENIWNANCLAFPQDPGDSEGHKSAIFEHASRINHSCICNAEWEWNAKGGFMALHAWMDLKPGDEVTIDYLGLPAWEMTAKDRRSELARDYNFLCRCDACEKELGYWDILEQKEEKQPLRRFTHQEENCSCEMCDYRGPEDYHCGDSGCDLAEGSDATTPDSDLPNCGWEYYWENLIPPEKFQEWKERRKQIKLCRSTVAPKSQRKRLIQKWHGFWSSLMSRF